MSSEEALVEQGPTGCALDDVRVVALASGVAGSVAAMLFGDVGAQVVRVTTAVETGSESFGRAVWDRGQQIVIPDEGTSPRSEWVRSLLDGADLCIVDGDFKAWSLAEFGVPFDDATDLLPHLVILHLPPLVGAAPWPGGEESHPLLAASGGLATGQWSLSKEPVELVYPHELYAQGLLGASAAIAALTEKGRSAQGQVVTVAGIDALMTLQAFQCEYERGVDPPSTRLNLPTEILRHKHRALKPDPFRGRYLCGDGSWVEFLATTLAMKQKVVDELGLAGMVADPRIRNNLDPDFLAQEGTRQWVKEQIAVACLNHSAREVAVRLSNAGCPAGPVLDRQEWFQESQVAALGLRVHVNDPFAGPLDIPGVAFGMSRNTTRPVQARRLSERPDAIAWDARPVPTGSAPKANGPLQGLRVISLAHYLAGSMVGSLLGEFGADVIKVEPVTGDPGRAHADLFHTNRGTRSIALDLRDPEIHAIVLQLIEGADVVVSNFRPGVLERLGLDHETLTRHNPGLLSVHLSGYGDVGPLGGHAGFNDILSAYSGITMAQGGTTDDKPMEMIAAPLDVGAALLGLFAVCAGIHARLRDGMGQRVWTSLAHASIFMQMSELVIRPGHDETGGPQSPLNSFVPTIDGWLRLQASDYAKEVSDLLLGMGQLNLETPDPDALYRALSAVVAPISRQQAEDLLAKAGIPSTATRSYQELILDDELVRDEVFHRFVRPDGREAFHVGRVARFSRTPRRGVVFTPRLGESTISLLTEVGKTLSDIERLRDAGVIRTE